MNRDPLIVGNWKMHKSAQEACAFITSLKPKITRTDRRIFLAVPFTALMAAVECARGSSIAIGGQNMHDHLEGAFTGEISAPMLKSCGATFVILGHSERRQYFAESNAFIQRKLVRALQEGITPILCIGEQEHERKDGHTKNVLTKQLEESFGDISAHQANQVVLAYEPVWAIGTGQTATPEIAQEIHHFIRHWLSKHFGLNCSQTISILYGGSVKPDNIASLMQQTDIDGVLVGGASLDVNSFSQLVNY